MASRDTPESARASAPSIVISARALSNRGLSDSGTLSRTFVTEARNDSSVDPSILGAAQAERTRMAATENAARTARPTRVRAAYRRTIVGAMTVESLKRLSKDGE